MTVIGLTLLSFAVRFVLLDRYPAPPSSDFGNYLTQLHIIQGADVEGVGLRYPPFFFLLLAPADTLLGGMLATKLLAAAVASSSCIPLFLIGRRWSDLPTAAAVTVLFTFSQAIAEMTAWGGSPNFLAITFFIFVLYFIDRAFSNPGGLTANAVAAGVFSGLVVVTHHLTMVVLLATLMLFFGFCMIRSKRSDKKMAVSVLKWMMVTGIPISLTALPVYLRMESNLSTVLGSYGPPTWDALIGPGGFHYILGAHWLAWLVVLVLGAAMIAHRFLRMRDRSTGTKLLIASALGPALLGLLVVKEAPGRVFIFMPIPLIIGFGMLVVALQKWARTVEPSGRRNGELRTVVLALFVADVVILSASGVQWMSDTVDWYHPLEENDVEALNWVRDNTAPHSVFATSGKLLSGHKEGDRLGWWIEGYSERKTVMAGSEMFRLFEDELRSTRDMNRFFAGTHVLENGYLQISDQYPISFKGNPEIAVRTAEVYEPLVFLNDATNSISYYTNDSSSTEIDETLDAVLKGPYVVDAEATRITTSSILKTANYEVLREVVLPAGEKSVSVRFKVSPSGPSVISQFKVYVWCSHGGEFKDITEPSNVTHLTVSDIWDPDVSIELESGVQVGHLESVTYLEKDPRWQLPALEYVVSSQEGIDFRLTFDVPSAHTDDGVDLAAHDGYSILSEYGVDYLFESTSMMLEIERFEKDTDHFAVVFRNSAVVIFKVL